MKIDLIKKYMGAESNTYQSTRKRCRACWKLSSATKKWVERIWASHTTNISRKARISRKQTANESNLIIIFSPRHRTNLCMHYFSKLHHRHMSKPISTHYLVNNLQNSFVFFGPFVTSPAAVSPLCENRQIQTSSTLIGILYYTDSLNLLCLVEQCSALL